MKSDCLPKEKSFPDRKDDSRNDSLSPVRGSSQGLLDETSIGHIYEDVDMVDMELVTIDKSSRSRREDEETEPHSGRRNPAIPNDDISIRIPIPTYPDKTFCFNPPRLEQRLNTTPKSEVLRSEAGAFDPLCHSASKQIRF